MEYFSLLPNEKIYEICEQMEIPTLSRFMGVNKRIYKICNEILRNNPEFYSQKRLYLTMMRVKELKAMLKERNLKIPRLKSEMIDILLSYKSDF